MPLYPFARERHWIERDERPAASIGGTPSLVSKRVESPLILQPVYSLNLDSTAHPWLAAHRIQGEAIVPATGFLVSALEVGRCLATDVRFCIRDLKIDAALPVAPSQAQLCQLVATERGVPGTSRSSRVATTPHRCRGVGTRRVDSNPLTHRRRSRGPTSPRYGGRCPRVLDGPAFYAGVARDGFEYGGAFLGLREAHVGDGEALGFVVGLPGTTTQGASTCSIPRCSMPACRPCSRWRQRARRCCLWPSTD